MSILLVACGGGVKENAESQKIAETNLRLGIGYLQQGRIEASLEKMQKALDAEPDYPQAHSAIALVYQRLGDNGKSAAHFEKALELSPDDGATHNNYAVLLCQRGQYAAAEQHFLQALRSRNYTTPAQAYENLGSCAMRIPDLEKAEGYLRKALQINPRFPVALLEMAQVSLDTQRYLSGRAYLQRYLEVAPHTAQSLWLGIQVETKLGDKAAVLNYLDQLSRHFPDSEEMRQVQEMERSR